jgi:hypothetical protein
MKHAMIEQASKDELAIADWCADWLLDSVACATQDRRFLRGEKECDAELCEAITQNAKIAALHAIKKAKSK